MRLLLTRKKLTEDHVANIFVNSTLRLVEEGFSDVAALINESPELITKPNSGEAQYGRFLMIVFSGNLRFVPRFFEAYQDSRIIDASLRKFAIATGFDYSVIKSKVAQCQQFMMRINLPSKNIHYAMSKAIVHQFGLINLQEEYFVKMQSPNPILLKRIDKILEAYIYHWDYLKENYKVIN